MEVLMGLSGQRWVYFLSPWDLRFELVSYPDGRAFDRTGG
jgi:glyoxylase I family protein